MFVKWLNQLKKIVICLFKILLEDKRNGDQLTDYEIKKSKLDNEVDILKEQDQNEAEE